MEIYANIARSLFAYPKCLYTRLQSNDVWLNFLLLAIILVNGSKRRGNISSPCQLVGLGPLHTHILQLRRAQSAGHFPNQRMRDMMDVCVGAPVTAKRPGNCCIQSSTNCKECKLGELGPWNLLTYSLTDK
jgi:hypothetical protein